MLSYLESKKASLEARKAVKSEVYADIDEQVEEYRKTLYTARNEAIDESNKIIDAQVTILNEVIEETTKAIYDSLDDSVDEVVDNDVDEVDDVVYG